MTNLLTLRHLASAAVIFGAAVTLAGCNSFTSQQPSLEPATAPEALAMGLVDVVTEPGNAVAAALADARKLAAGPPLALAAIKRAIGRWPMSREQALDLETDIMVEMFTSADFAEGVAAFRERRSPRFEGH